MPPAIPSNAKPGLGTTEAIRALAPTGELRVGVFAGSPSSYLVAMADAPARGLSYDLGHALARHLGLGIDIRVMPGYPDVLAALSSAEIDFAVTNVTPERRQRMHFAPVLFDVPKGALVPRGSRVRTIADLSFPGTVIGVSKGSSTHRELAVLFPAARLCPVETLEEARALLRAARLDAFATNKAILFEMADRLLGAEVLEGEYGAEHFAIATPSGRGPAAVGLLHDFNARVRADGYLQHAIKRAGLRGASAPTEP